MTILTGSWPILYKRLRRFIRDVLRTGIGICMACLVYLAVSGFLSHAFFLTTGFFVFWKYYFAKREKQKKLICHGCDELNCREVCSEGSVRVGSCHSLGHESSQATTNRDFFNRVCRCTHFLSSLYFFLFINTKYNFIFYLLFSLLFVSIFNFCLSKIINCYNLLYIVNNKLFYINL